MPGKGEPGYENRTSHNCYGYYFLSKSVSPVLFIVGHDVVHQIWFQRMVWLKITLFCGPYHTCHPPKPKVHLATYCFHSDYRKNIGNVYSVCCEEMLSYLINIFIYIFRTKLCLAFITKHVYLYSHSNIFRCYHHPFAGSANNFFF